MAMPATTETGGPRPQAEVILEVHGLTKVFGSGRAAVRAVDGLSLSVRRGELVLVMGPSGSGKTTLLTLIGGLLRPTSGIVRVNGLEITSLKERQLTKFRRHYLGFIFQSFNLLESLNARENVEAALNFAGVGGRKARKRAVQLLFNLILHPIHRRGVVRTYALQLTCRVTGDMHISQALVWKSRIYL